MFKAFIGFNKAILAMPKPWQVWMVLLVSVNLVLPFFFLGTPEAIVVLVGVIASLFIMTTLFSKFGFVRLLGLGHIPWLFTVPWLGLQLGQTMESGPFYYWLLSVIVLDSISLVIDAVDVARYWMGERQPTITADINAF
ncbi:MAG: hypothetical protein V3R23_07720 [Nitrospinaceae bacterium]